MSLNLPTFSRGSASATAYGRVVLVPRAWMGIGVPAPVRVSKQARGTPALVRLDIRMMNAVSVLPDRPRRQRAREAFGVSGCERHDRAACASTAPLSSTLHRATRRDFGWRCRGNGRRASTVRESLPGRESDTASQPIGISPRSG